MAKYQEAGILLSAQELEQVRGWGLFLRELAANKVPGADWDSEDEIALHTFLEKYKKFHGVSVDTVE